MLNDAIAGRYWQRLAVEFPQFQFAILDSAGQVVAIGNSIPFFWETRDRGPEGGWDGVLEKGFLDTENGTRPNALSALSITVSKSVQGRGVSAQALAFLKKTALQHGLDHLLAPVRPSLKKLYPLIAMTDYVHWKNADQSPFDPWLRAHWKQGAKIMNVQLASMAIKGSAANWSDWTGLTFPQSGSYVVPGGLVPMEYSKEIDQGIYLEPNVWMLHALDF
jgi:hypothetical protein